MAASSNYLSVLQITDTHIKAMPDETLLGVKTAHYFNSVIELASRSGMTFDLCLITGDLAQDPVPESYQYLLDTMENYPFPTVCLPGNHDDFGIMQAVLCTETVNCRKRVTLGNWQIICLNSQIINSADGLLSAIELSYLENSLKDNPDLFTLIAVHHNCVPCGSDWMDVMMIKNAQELFDLIKRYPNVKTIINGHIHQATDDEVNAVRILSTPSTCFQFTPRSEHFSLDDKSPGYRWLKLYDDGNVVTGVVHSEEKLIGLQTANTGGY
jgi:3',5'-cyclic-AMP phosphodiesterase